TAMAAAPSSALKKACRARRRSTTCWVRINLPAKRKKAASSGLFVCWRTGLLLFGKGLDCLGDFVLRGFRAVEACEFHDLAAFRQLLVDAEECFETLLFDLRQIGDFLDVVIGRIDVRGRHGNDLVVLVAAVDHLQ